jgi:hypothetical protein
MRWRIDMRKRIDGVAKGATRCGEFTGSAACIPGAGMS